MTDQTVQRKLHQLEGNLFYESGGTFSLMDGDCNGNGLQRQAHIRFDSKGFCRMGAGAW